MAVAEWRRQSGDGGVATAEWRRQSSYDGRASQVWFSYVEIALRRIQKYVKDKVRYSCK